MAYKIIIDPGHGGSDPGATYNGRQEKDDALRMAMDVGDLLKNAGFDVVYTRTTDVYNTPFEKATIGNEAGGDLIQVLRELWQEILMKILWHLVLKTRALWNDQIW